MSAATKSFLLKLARNSAFAVLLFALAGLLGFLAKQYGALQWDVSQNGRNSLSEASRERLRQMPEAIAVTIYATQQDAKLGDLRKIMSDFFLLYQREKPNFSVTFIDPTEQPKLAQAAGISVNGEMVVAYEKRSEHLTTLNEQAFTQLLTRLARVGNKQLMWLSGHGERRLDGAANHDLGEFGKRLSGIGIAAAALNLAIAQDVPGNVGALIIASPQTDLFKGEVGKLVAYVEAGGNLLWLIDAEPLRGLEALAEKLQLNLTPGVVVDPQATQLGAPLTLSLGANYAPHPILKNFNYVTVFPFARQIAANENSGWKTTALVEVAQTGWLETGKLEGAPTFDKAREVAGPVSIAAAMTRKLKRGANEEHEQRIVIVGSGHFLANTYLGNGGNLDLGINLVNWLLSDDAMIATQPRATLDASLNLSKTALAVIAIGFLIVLPLAFVIGGALIWWRRRSAG